MSAQVVKMMRARHFGRRLAPPLAARRCSWGRARPGVRDRPGPPLAPALTDASWWVPGNGCSDAPPGEESCVGPAWIADPARPLEQPNQRRGRIELAGVDTVASRLREGVVGVVPRLAHRQDR